MKTTASRTVSRALLRAALVVALAGCAGAQEPPPPARVSRAPIPAQVSGRSASELERTLVGLRNALSDQEQRIESARRAIQSLSDQIEKNRSDADEARKRSDQMIEDLKTRLETLENELAVLRTSGLKAGGAPGGAQPSTVAGQPAEEPAVGAPKTGGEQMVAGTGGSLPPVAAGTPAAGAAHEAPASAAPAEEGAAGQAPQTEAKAPDPEVEFNEAMRALREEHSLPRARVLLRAFLEKYPTNDLADDAQYWIGQTYFEEKNYERAILAFNKVQVDYANGDKAPDALLQEALSFLNLGDRASARELLGRLIGKYPGTDAAEKAREQLKSL